MLGTQISVPLSSLQSLEKASQLLRTRQKRSLRKRRAARPGGSTSGKMSQIIRMWGASSPGLRLVRLNMLEPAQSLSFIHTLTSNKHHSSQPCSLSLGEEQAFCWVIVPSESSLSLSLLFLHKESIHLGCRMHKLLSLAFNGTIAHNNWD